jgi:hypothetical protein
MNARPSTTVSTIGIYYIKFMLFMSGKIVGNNFNISNGCGINGSNDKILHHCDYMFTRYREQFACYFSVCIKYTGGVIAQSWVCTLILNIALINAK